MFFHFQLLFLMFFHYFLKVSIKFHTYLRNYEKIRMLDDLYNRLHNGTIAPVSF